MKLALFQPKPAFYVAIGAIGLYSICLTFGFFWDDSVIIVKNAVIKNIQYIPDFFSLRYWQFFDPGSPGHYRPMRLLGFSMLHALFGPEPIVYHAWNLFLYCILSIFLLRFGTAIGLSPMASLAATVLFVVHPLHVEVVAWAKNSSELLATLFIILSWIYLLKYLDADLKADQTKKRIFLMISLLLYSFSLMSKEIGVVLPVLLLVFLVLYKSELNLTEKIRIVLPYVLVSLCMVFFILLFLHPGMPGNPMVKQLPIEKSILLVPLTITVYIKLLCFPYPLNIDRSLDGPFSSDLMNFFIPLVFLVTLIIFHLFLAKKNKTLAFFFFWIIISLIPVSNIFYIYGRPIAEQRAFWASIGFCFYFGECLRLLSASLEKSRASSALKNGVIISVCIIVLLLSAVTMKRLTIWSDQESLWKDTIQQSPDSARAINNLGAIYSARNDLDKAGANFQLAIKKDPKYALAHYNLGITQKKKGEMENAMQSFRTCLESDPAFAASSMEIGLFYLGNSQLDKAMRFLKSALYYDHSNPYIHYHLGVVYHRMFNLDETEKMYRSAISLNPCFPEVYNDLAVILEKKGDLEGALYLYNQALARDPSFTVGRLNLGIYYFKRRYYQFALTEFNKCIEDNPKFVPGYLNSCKTLIAQKQYDDALTTVNQLLAFEPENRDAKLLKGNIFLEMDQMTQGIRLFREVANAFPEHGPAKLWLAKALVRMGDRVETERLSRELERDNQPHPKLYYELGKIFMGLGQNDKGETLLLRSLELDPQNLEVRVFIAKDYFDRGKMEAALRLCEPALSRKEPDPSILVLSARIYTERGLYQEALDRLSRATDTYEKMGEIYALEGNALHGMGRHEEAIRAYVKAIRINYNTGRNLLRAVRIIRYEDISLKNFPFLSEFMKSSRDKYEHELAAQILARNFSDQVIEKFETLKKGLEGEDLVLLDFYLGTYLEAHGKTRQANEYLKIAAKAETRSLPEVAWAKGAMGQGK